MQRTLTLLAAAALVLTGCTSEDDGDPTASPTQSETAASPSGDETDPAPSPSPSATDPDDVAAMDFTTCQAADYSVAYPSEWETNPPSDLVDACRLFHPGTIDLPDRPRDIDLHWAAALNIDDVPYQDIVEGEPTGQVLQERETTIDGRDARIIEVRSTGEALVPEGETRYGYAIDLDGRTLFASTYTVGETDYARDKRVLDRTVESLDVTVGE
jgi:hypothetical protein